MNSKFEQMYRYDYLPRYAAYLLQHYLDDYTREQIQLSYKIELPLLKHLTYLSEEEIFLLAKSGTTDFLTALSNNTSKEHIEKSLHLWLTNQIPVIDKLSIKARDITLLNFVRQKVLKNWLPTYTTDLGTLLKVNEEIDELILAYNTTSTDAYLKILKESIEEESNALLKRERQLLEAQSIGQIGSYEWDIVNDKSESTPELRKIFEAEKRQTLEEILEKVHPEDKAKLKKSIDEAFKTGIYKCEYRYLTKIGEKVIDSRGVVSYDAQGKPVTLTGTIQDITERKKIEEELILKTLELERSNVQLQEFAYVASHDLKEPLRKITIFSNIIMTSDADVLSERGKANFKKIIEATKRMQQLIEGILSYSSLSSEGGKERCNLQDALNEAINNLEFKIKEIDASIVFDHLPTIEAIPFQMQQLFQNLISNGLKFSNKSKRSSIYISCKSIISDGIINSNSNVRPAPQYLQIEVRDNGIGFDNERSEKMFGLFQRLHGRGEYEGSGLGLAICKKIVENHGGTIRATSEQGQGATFTIILPVENNTIAY